MNIWRRFAPQFAVLGVVCLIAAIGIVKKDVIGVNADADTRQTVIIDAGHGGFDGGAQAADGTIEKDINLHIALKVAQMLRFDGFNVIMTRTGDTGTEDDESAAIAKRKKSDLSNRLQIMKDNPDAVFVSIHLNKFTTSAASGAQVFYTKNYEQARALAESLQSNIKNLIQPQNTRVAKQGTDSTYLLKNAVVPAVIVECGFLSNKAELEKLKQDDYQSQIAFAVFCGITEYLS